MIGLDTLADNETAMAILRLIVRRARFIKIEAHAFGAAMVMGFPLKLVELTDTEAKLIVRLRAEGENK